jgi:hypothetical protein
MKRHNKKASPLLAGEKHGVGLVAVWCPYCKRHHYHGWSPDAADNDASHRVAHCGGDSLFKTGGYYITIEPTP